MERPFVRWFRVYVLDAMIVVSAALGAWAAWGSPSPVTSPWVAVVGVELVIVTALAVRDGSPTPSVAHVTPTPTTLFPTHEEMGSRARPRDRRDDPAGRFRADGGVGSASRA